MFGGRLEDVNRLMQIHPERIDVFLSRPLSIFLEERANTHYLNDVYFYDDTVSERPQVGNLTSYIPG